MDRIELKNMIDNFVRENNWRNNHTKINKYYSFCKYSGLVLVENCQCTGCNDLKRMEYIVGNIIGGLNKTLIDWYYTPQFKHNELRSGKSRNDYLRFDFAGFRGESVFEKNPRVVLPNCAIEVNEKSHYIEKDSTIYKMKTSDFLKWDFCIRYRIPLLYVEVPKFFKLEGKKIQSELENLSSFFIEKAMLMESYYRLIRSHHDKDFINDYFIKNFTNLPGDRVELDFNDFKENEHLNLESTCVNLIELANNGNIDEYVRTHYFSENISAII